MPAPLIFSRAKVAATISLSLAPVLAPSIAVAEKYKMQWQKAGVFCESMDVSKDGREIVFAFVPKASDHRFGVQVLDAATGVTKEEYFQTPRTSYSRSIFSYDGKLIAAGNGPRIDIINRSRREIDRTVELDDDQKTGLNSLSFSPDGERLAAAQPSGAVATVWNIKTGAIVHKLRHRNPGDRNNVEYVEFSPNGKHIVTVGGQVDSDQKVRLWDAITGSMISETSAPDGSLFRPRFNSDGTRLVVGGRGTVWTVAVPFAGWRLVMRHPTEKTNPTEVGISSDSLRTLSMFQNATLMVNDIYSGKSFHSIKAYRKSSYKYSIGGNGEQIFTLGADDVLKCAVKSWVRN